MPTKARTTSPKKPFPTVCSYPDGALLRWEIESFPGGFQTASYTLDGVPLLFVEDDELEMLYQDAWIPVSFIGSSQKEKLLFFPQGRFDPLNVLPFDPETNLFRWSQKEAERMKLIPRQVKKGS